MERRIKPRPWNRKPQRQRRSPKFKALTLPPPPLLPAEIDELTAFAREKLEPVLERSEAIESLRLSRAFIKEQPVRFAQVYYELLAGKPPYLVCQQIEAPYDVVSQIRRTYPEIVQAGRAQIIHNLEQVSLSLSTRLALEGMTLPIDKVAGTLATTIEKLQLLTGNVTSRQEHISAPKPEELKEMFEQLPMAKAEIIQ